MSATCSQHTSSDSEDKHCAPERDIGKVGTVIGRDKGKGKILTGREKGK